jgi:hypothetical protein
MSTSRKKEEKLDDDDDNDNVDVGISLAPFFLMILTGECIFV